jgi:hypothetical protein
MSGFQSPELLTDLYRDLRDRRLLPLVLVLVVGLAVVPIALSSKSTSTPASPAAPATPVAKKSNLPATAVVVSNPGVRDYTRRLKDSPQDPFVTPAFALAGTSSATSSSSTSSTASTGTTTSGTTTSGTTTSGATAPTGGSTSQPVQTESKYFFYRVKLRTGEVGQDLKVRDSVGTLTPLPSKNVPALDFLGVTTNSSFQPTRAVFLVSSAVSSVAGEGTCTFAGTYCQIVSLKSGEHEDVVWTDGRTYRVDLVKFDLIVRNSPPSVAGQGSSGGGSGSGSAPGRHFTF